MSAGAAAAAVAVRERTRQEAARKKAEKEAANKRWLDEQKALSEGPLDFHKALAALKAKRAAEQAEALRQRPTTSALYDRDKRPQEVVGRSGQGLLEHEHLLPVAVPRATAHRDFNLRVAPIRPAHPHHDHVQLRDDGVGVAARPVLHLEGRLHRRLRVGLFIHFHLRVDE